MKAIFSRNFFIQVSYFCAFYLLMWIFYLLIMSVVSFFHFQLDHSLKVIENWVFDQGWKVISLATILSVSVVLKFINVKSDWRRPFWEGVAKGITKPKREFFIFLISMLLAFVIIYQPQRIDRVTLEILKACFSFAGVFTFLLGQIIVSFFLDLFYPLSNAKGKGLKLVLFSLLSAIVTAKTFPFALNLGVYVFLFLALSIFLSYLEGGNWSLPALFVGFFVAPINALMGLDLVWLNQFSFFDSAINFRPFHLGIILVVGFFYLNFKKNRNEINLS